METTSLGWAIGLTVWTYLIFRAGQIYRRDGMTWRVLGYVSCVAFDLLRYTTGYQVLYFVSVLALVTGHVLDSNDGEGPERRARRAVGKLKGLVPSILPRPYTA